MIDHQKPVQDLYNDPGSLFFCNTFQSTPPKEIVQTQPQKTISKPTQKTTAINEQSKVERFNNINFANRVFTKNNDEENKQNKTIPIGTMNSYFYSSNMQPKAIQKNQIAYLHEIEEAYKKDGTKGLPKEILKLKEVIDIFQKWQLTSNTLLFADGASGIYKALTIPGQAYFKDFTPLYNKDKEIEKYVIYATFDQLVKCFFGVCVDEYGNLKRGTSEILKKSGILKEFTDAIFMSSDGKSTGKEPVLFMYDKASNFLGYYKPIVFSGYDERRKAFRVELDPRFFHLEVEKGYLKVAKGDRGRYIPTIGGLTALNIIGRAHLAKENPGLKLPNSKTATRLIHTLQASLNMQSLLGIKMFPDMKSSEDKQKIRLDRVALAEMFPTCYNKTTHYMNFKEASRQTGLISDILYKGLEVTNGINEILMAQGNNKIFLPSIDESCYFDFKYKKAVFVNCETPRHAISNTKKISYIELQRQIEQSKNI